MNTCGMTRLLVPAFVVGFAVATFVGNDLSGWIAAGVTVAVLAAVQKVRGSERTCAIPTPPDVDDQAGVDLAPPRTDLTSRGVERLSRP